MKREDVEKLPDLGPYERANLMLSMGTELKKRPRKAPDPGTLLPPLRRESVTQTVAAPMIERMHGIRGAAPQLGTGLQDTGRTLKTRAGEIPQIVLTPRARNASAEHAMDAERDRSVGHLALRQCALGMVDSDPVPRCCAAYAYWQGTGAKYIALPVLLTASESEDEEERTVAAHCVARVLPYA